MFRCSLQEVLIVPQCLRHLHIDMLEVSDLLLLLFVDILGLISGRAQYPMLGFAASLGVRFRL
jgi:hypothetical protein